MIKYFIFFVIIFAAPYFIWHFVIRIRAAKKSQKRDLLLSQGMVVEARIKDFLQEDSYGRNIVVIKVVAEAYLDDKQYEFISEKTYPENLKNYKIGDIVKVFVDENNFYRYSFVINDTM